MGGAGWEGQVRGAGWEGQVGGAGGRGWMGGHYSATSKYITNLSFQSGFPERFNSAATTRFNVYLP